MSAACPGWMRGVRGLGWMREGWWITRVRGDVAEHSDETEQIFFFSPFPVYINFKKFYYTEQTFILLC